MTNTNRKQRTISAPISCTGVGLHTGVESTITFKPAPENYGIQFSRTDVIGSPEIRADIEHVVDISRGTTIGQNGVRIHTVEHALAAVSGLRIDNVLIEFGFKLVCMICNMRLVSRELCYTLQTLHISRITYQYTT